jgi:Fe-S oxidoreductase
MNPWLMATVLVLLWGAFFLSAFHRLALLKRTSTTWESRTASVGERLKAVWVYAFYQKKMRYYFVAGVAHQLIFVGFLVLLARSIVLWGRGFDPSFNLWVLGHEPVLGVPFGDAYAFLKDVFAVLVLCGAIVFLYYRAVRRERRMTLGWEGLAILFIIIAMMLGDLVYDGAAHVLNANHAAACADGGPAWCESAAPIVAPLGAPSELAFAAWPDPAGSTVASWLAGVDPEALIALSHAGFWTHAILVVVFLNILPYTKHFHIITAVPNVYLGDLSPRGRLKPLAESTEGLMHQVEQAMEKEDVSAARIGYARIGHFSWKDALDFYTCTECGRCSDHCPASQTGKLLSPKHFTLDLRDHLYQLGRAERKGDAKVEADTALVPNVIHPDVLWACTTCRACEEQCPVNISYVDKIVQMRRNLVVVRGEFPAELGKPFEGMETNGNPWNLARVDRKSWADGLGVPKFAEKPDAEILFWVGCAASYDDRAKKIARSTAELLLLSGVDFAILAEEESCTGDPARRAGNEYLFSMLAEANAQTLNAYREQGGIRRIVTTCPHCFNTLKNEYPDFGARFEVVHHSDFLLELMAAGKLVPKKEVRARVAFHDSCYLGRYNDIYESPREVLAKIPGVTLTEVPHANRRRGLCCGAGGAQMWMEEQNRDRVNVKRTRQLLETGADVVASACPFCMTMLTDGLKAESREAEVKNLDLVEVLALSCGVGEAEREGRTEDGSV